eukprot:tig00000769_g3999.t1
MEPTGPRGRARRCPRSGRPLRGPRPAAAVAAASARGVLFLAAVLSAVCLAAVAAATATGSAPHRKAGPHAPARASRHAAYAHDARAHRLPRAEAGDATRHPRKIFLLSHTIDTEAAPALGHHRALGLPAPRAVHGRPHKSHSPSPSSSSAARASAYFVHMQAGLAETERRAAEACIGASLATYVPHNTYLVPLDPAAAARATPTTPTYLASCTPSLSLLFTACPGVLWVDAMHPAHKLHRAADAVPGLAPFYEVAFASAAGPFADSPEAGAAVEELRTALKAAGVAASVKQGFGAHARVSFDPAAVDAAALADLLAEQDGWEASGRTPAEVAAELAAPDAARRKLVARQLLVDREDTPDYELLYHGTAAASVIAGCPSANWPVAAERDAMAKHCGVARGAKLFVQGVGTGSGSLDIPADLIGKALAPAYEAGVRIHSNSWGSSKPGEEQFYTPTSAQFDFFAWLNKDFLPVFAAGNEGFGGTPRTIGSPASSKNGLAVAAAMSSRRSFASSFPFEIITGAEPNMARIDAASCAATGLPLGHPDTPCPGTDGCCADSISSDAKGDWRTVVRDWWAAFNETSEADLAYYSSRGPAFDGRSRPNIAGIGTYVVAARADSNFTFPGQCGFYGPRADASVVGSSIPALETFTGTSAATPTISGAAALVRQYFRDGFYPGGSSGSGPSISASASLVKAVLLNAARPLAGVQRPGYSSERGFFPPTPARAGEPNFDSGFGLPVLTRALFFEGASSRNLTFFERNVTASDAGAVHGFTVKIANPAEELRVTLVYADYPAFGSAAIALVNDLDLAASVDGGPARHPNGLGGPDALNNEEAITLPAADLHAGALVHINVTVRSMRSPDAAGPLLYTLVVTGGFLREDAAALGADLVAPAGAGPSVVPYVRLAPTGPEEATELAHPYWGRKHFDALGQDVLFAVERPPADLTGARIALTCAVAAPAANASASTTRPASGCVQAGLVYASYALDTLQQETAADGVTVWRIDAKFVACWPTGVLRLDLVGPDRALLGPGAPFELQFVGKPAAEWRARMDFDLPRGFHGFESSAGDPLFYIAQLEEVSILASAEPSWQCPFAAYRAMPAGDLVQLAGPGLWSQASAWATLEVVDEDLGLNQRRFRVAPAAALANRPWRAFAAVALDKAHPDYPAFAAAEHIDFVLFDRFGSSSSLSFQYMAPPSVLASAVKYAADARAAVAANDTAALRALPLACAAAPFASASFELRTEVLPELEASGAFAPGPGTVANRSEEVRCSWAGLPDDAAFGRSFIALMSVDALAEGANETVLGGSLRARAFPAGPAFNPQTTAFKPISTPAAACGGGRSARFGLACLPKGRYACAVVLQQAPASSFRFGAIRMGEEDAASWAVDRGSVDALVYGQCPDVAAFDVSDAGSLLFSGAGARPARLETRYNATDAPDVLRCALSIPGGLDSCYTKGLFGGTIISERVGFYSGDAIQKFERLKAAAEPAYKTPAYGPLPLKLSLTNEAIGSEALVEYPFNITGYLADAAAATGAAAHPPGALPPMVACGLFAYPSFLATSPPSRFKTSSDFFVVQPRFLHDPETLEFSPGDFVAFGPPPVPVCEEVMQRLQCDVCAAMLQRPWQLGPLEPQRICASITAAAASDAGPGALLAALLPPSPPSDLAVRKLFAMFVAAGHANGSDPAVASPAHPCRSLAAARSAEHAAACAPFLRWADAVAGRLFAPACEELAASALFDVEGWRRLAGGAEYALNATTSPAFAAHLRSACTNNVLANRSGDGAVCKASPGVVGGLLKRSTELAAEPAPLGPVTVHITYPMESPEACRAFAGAQDAENFAAAAVEALRASDAAAGASSLASQVAASRPECFVDACGARLPLPPVGAGLPPLSRAAPPAAHAAVRARRGLELAVPAFRGANRTLLPGGRVRYTATKVFETVRVQPAVLLFPVPPPPSARASAAAAARERKCAALAAQARLPALRRRLLAALAGDAAAPDFDASMAPLADPLDGTPAMAVACDTSGAAPRLALNLTLWDNVNPFTARNARGVPAGGLVPGADPAGPDAAGRLLGHLSGPALRASLRLLGLAGPEAAAVGRGGRCGTALADLAARLLAGTVNKGPGESKLTAAYNFTLTFANLTEAEYNETLEAHPAPLGAALWADEIYALLASLLKDRPACAARGRCLRPEQDGAEASAGVRRAAARALLQEAGPSGAEAVSAVRLACGADDGCVVGGRDFQAPNLAASPIGGSALRTGSTIVVPSSPELASGSASKAAAASLQLLLSLLAAAAPVAVSLWAREHALYRLL